MPCCSCRRAVSASSPWRSPACSCRRGAFPGAPPPPPPPCPRPARGLLVSAGVLPGDASPAATLLPALGAMLALGCAAAFAVLGAPSAPPRGRMRLTVWRAWRFVHSGARETLHLLARGDRLLIAGAV